MAPQITDKFVRCYCKGVMKKYTELGIAKQQNKKIIWEVCKWLPVQVQGLQEVVEIAGGYLHSLAIKADGIVWVWGYNGFGSYGDGTSNSSNLPVYIGNSIN